MICIHACVMECSFKGSKGSGFNVSLNLGKREAKRINVAVQINIK